MAILAHGSDLSLAPTLAPLVAPSGGKVDAALKRIAAMGFHAVQLDATLRGLRPREMSSRQRRDLIAAVGRRSLAIAGIDCFIPRRHYTDPHEVDRAMAATLAAVTLAADLGRVPLSLSLPVRDMSADAKAAIVEAADGHGVRLAIHDERHVKDLLAWLEQVDLPLLGAGLDPAAVLAQSKVPDQVLHIVSKRLAVARLSDASSPEADDDDTTAGAARTTIGAGDLDVIPYRIALDLIQSRTGPVVLDLRGLTDALHAAEAGAKAWENAAFSV